jgi:hypothetical protein
MFKAFAVFQQQPSSPSAYSCKKPFSSVNQKFSKARLQTISLQSFAVPSYLKVQWRIVKTTFGES